VLVKTFPEPPPAFHEAFREVLGTAVDPVIDLGGEICEWCNLIRLRKGIGFPQGGDHGIFP